MIAGVNGKLESIGPNWAIVNVGGVSLQIFLPTSTLAGLGNVGQQVRLHTHLHVREDNLTLYGFSSARELALFQTLITVSGIGPKIGMAMLSAMDVEQLALAIASGNADLLTSIPGIGKKTSNRIILELKDKISASVSAIQELEAVQGNTEVLEALTSLGYSVSEAMRAVATLPSSSSFSLEEKVKVVLRFLGGNK
jgi:holliday junction DNA helicase RuvA